MGRRKAEKTPEQIRAEATAELRRRVREIKAANGAQIEPFVSLEDSERMAERLKPLRSFFVKYVELLDGVDEVPQLFDSQFSPFYREIALLRYSVSPVHNQIAAGCQALIDLGLKSPRESTPQRLRIDIFRRLQFNDRIVDVVKDNPIADTPPSSTELTDELTYDEMLMYYEKRKDDEAAKLAERSEAMTNEITKGGKHYD